jgi:hypothetical protein
MLPSEPTPEAAARLAQVAPCPAEDPAPVDDGRHRAAPRCTGLRLGRGMGLGLGGGLS